MPRFAASVALRIALHDLGHPVDVHQPVDELAVLLAIAGAISRFSCHVTVSLARAADPLA
jgi:hypothetical protein